MPTKKCPVCGVAVKLENLERHVRNQHPRDTVDIETLLSEEERREAESAKAAARPTITRKGVRLIAILTVVMAVILVIAIFNPFRGMGPNVGELAPNFTLSTSEGGSISLSNYRGKPLFLEFMDWDCEACQLEAPILSSLYPNYSARVSFLSVDMINWVPPDDTAQRINQDRVTYNTPWIYVLDTQRTVANMYKISATPTSFILDRNGVISQVFVGRPNGGYATYAAELDKVV